MWDPEPPTQEELELEAISERNGVVIVSPGALLNKEHWAILVNYRKYNSCNNAELSPLTYIAYYNLIDWQDSIKYYSLSGIEFVAFPVKPVKVTTEVNIKIDG